MISYKPLFRLLLERDMTKTQLREAVGFSSATLAKMSKGEYISLETVENICKYLNCKIEDVIETQPCVSIYFLNCFSLTFPILQMKYPSVQNVCSFQKCLDKHLLCNFHI